MVRIISSLIVDYAVGFVVKVSYRGRNLFRSLAKYNNNKSIYIVPRSVKIGLKRFTQVWS